MTSSGRRTNFFGNKLCFKHNGGVRMKIIHVMADGTVRESIEGLVIKNKEFYEVLKVIQRKKVAG